MMQRPLSPIRRTSIHRTFRTTLPAVVLLGVLLGGVLAAPPAEARWSQVAAINVQENWELIRQASWMAGIEDHAPVLAAMLAHETNFTAIRGMYRPDIWGPGQISWSSWGALLKKKGVAQQPEDMIIDLYTGVLATAVVLAHLRDTYRERTLDQVLCLYGCGPLALGYTKDCKYSRGVMDNVNRVHRVIWALAEEGRQANGARTAIN